jgi:hypothetical protein
MGFPLKNPQFYWIAASSSPAAHSLGWDQLVWIWHPSSTMLKTFLARKNFQGPHVWDKPGLFGYLVCLVQLVDCTVHL